MTARRALLFVAACLAAACASSPQPKPQPKPRPAPTPPPPPYVASVDPFPVAEAAPTELQPLFDELVAELQGVDIDRSPLCSKGADALDDAHERRLRARDGVASAGLHRVAALALVTIARARADNPELDVLLDALGAELQTVEARPGATLDAVMWVATEALVRQHCATRRATASVLSLVQWATTPDLMYRSLFEVWNRALLRVPDGRGFWTQQAQSIEAFRNVVFRVPTGSKHARQPRQGGEVSVRAAGIPLACRPQVNVVADLGTTGTHNGLVDAGELVLLTWSCRNTSSTRRLMSESLVLTGQSPCLVALDREVELAEVPPGGAVAIRPSPILVAGTCGDEVHLTYTLESSHAAAGTVGITLRPRRAGLRAAAVALDEDRPGSSNPDPRPGIGAGDRVELLLSAEVDDRHQAHLGVLEVADPGAVAPVELRVGLPLAMEPLAGRVVTTDDVDVTAKSGGAWVSVRSQRMSGAPLTAPGAERLWLRATFGLEAAPRVLEEAGRDPRAKTLYKSWRGAAPELGFAGFLRALAQMQALAREGLRVALESQALARAVDPEHGAVVGAIARLVEAEVLPQRDLSRALQHLDRLRYSTAGHPADRTLARQLVIATQLLEVMGAADGADFLRSVGVFELPPEAALVGLRDAIVRHRAARTLTAALGAAPRPELVEEAVRTFTASAGAPSAAAPAPDEWDLPVPGQLYTVTRYLPVPLHE